MKPQNHNIDDLLDTMAQLRDPVDGCPWDLKQDFASLCSYTIEEAYEVVDAIQRNNPKDLMEELGDLLFQVVFYAQIAKEKGLFDFADVVTSINDKMIERHPHVFSTEDNNRLSSAAMNKRWEQQKLQKRQKNHQNSSVLDDIPSKLPELLKSVKLTKRAAVIGFDWPNVEPVFDKMQEELTELQEAIASGHPQHIQDELGDVIFVCTNLARHLKQDPQLALRHANQKFERRFRAVETLAKSHCSTQTEYDLNQLEQWWIATKNQE